MKKLQPFLIPFSLLIIALSIFTMDTGIKFGNEQTLGATTKIRLTDPNSVTPAATSTPTASMIPIASSTGKISDNWINFYNSSLYANFQAGENITKGNAVIIGRGTSNLSGTANYTGSATGETIDYNTWQAQKYTTTAQAKYITKVSVMGNSDNLVTFDMSANPVAVSSGTVYWMVIKRVSGFDSGYPFLQIQTNGADKPSNVVIATSTKTSGGDSAAFGYFSTCSAVGGINTRYSRTTDAGSTWTSADGCIGANGTGVEFSVYEKMTTSSLIYKANSTNNDEFVNFIGFADENISANSFGKVNVDGIDNNQTGLSVGYPYYLTNTSGVVSTTNGTITTIIGIAVSSTAIRINN
jgi:hypothetical protein